MAKQFSLEEQLSALSPEQLEAIKQEFLKRQGGGEREGETPGGILARGAGQAGLAIGEGALLGLQKRPISELSVGKPGPRDPLEDLLQREKLKNELDPTRRKSQLELEEIQRQQKAQASGGGVPGVAAPGDVSTAGATSKDVAGASEEAPEMFISVPKGKDKFGIIQYDTIKNPAFGAFQKRQELSQKEEVGLKADVIKGKLVNTNNLNLLSGVVRDLSQVYADAFEEGGAGGIIQKTVAGLATKVGDLPESFGLEDPEIGGKFAASGAFPGKRMELILKMMPMLTQQATKAEGSVRIITGVLDALGMTIPELGTAPATADRQLTESLLTFYRFARSAEQLGMSIDEAFQGRDPNTLSQDEITSWAQSVASQSASIIIEGEEQKSLDSFIEQSLEPIRNIRRPGGKDKKSLAQPTSAPAGVEMIDAQGNRALVDPNTGKVIKEL